MRKLLFMDLATEITDQTENFMAREPFISLKHELVDALSLYWTTATQILQGSGINVLDPAPEYFSIKKNFFSSLFLYSYFRAGIPKTRRVLYAAVNQCLRGMVTGCDNILDNEYKKTLETDLPEQGTRFRSVIDIMVSDRVLFSILYRGCQSNMLSPDQVLAASSASLRALAGSGAQEAAEEGGVMERLMPEKILASVHHYKTALLFQCPWAVPTVIERHETKEVPVLKNALYQIGMGCQILDDMVDLSRDLRMRRHNYVISLIHHGGDLKERTRLETRPSSKTESKDAPDLLLEYPDAMRSAGARALAYLKSGTEALFADQHRFLVNPSIAFIARQIGAHRFLSNNE